ncbi:MAG: glycosyltransferase [Actinobacteria bacterium]|nr:glycosyltransferase [Actinomycetota bacterium]
MRDHLLDSKKITVIHSVSRWLQQTETWQYNQVMFLPSDIENHIVCEATENLDQFPMPNIHSLLEAPRWRYFWDKGLRKLRVRNYLGLLVEQARMQHPQILHSHFGNMGWVNMRAARRLGLKHVVTFYGLDVNYLPKKDQRWHKRYRKLFEQIDRILCEGPHMARCVIGLGCPGHKVQVHHLGVRVSEIAFKPRLWDPSEPLRVLIAGSFREKKGIPYALEALGRLQHEIPLQVTIIGDASDAARSKAEKQKILATLERYGLQMKTRMLGYRPHDILFEEAYKHHIFLSPSVTASDGDTEGGVPVTIIEMVATGMPVVSTTHCDIPEVVHHGITGLLAEERDVNGLVHHLRWLIDNPEQWGYMLEAGRKHMEVEYDARAQGKRLAAIYRGLAIN